MKKIVPEGVFKTRSRPKFLFFFAIGAVVVSIGTALAANITLNGTTSPNSLVFGQGVVQSTSCDDQITIVPKAKYINSTSTFKMESITLSGISAECLGKSFTINGYKAHIDGDSSSDLPLPFSTGSTPGITVYFKVAAVGGNSFTSDQAGTSVNGGSWTITNADGTSTNSDHSLDNNHFTITFDDSNTVLANQLKTLTIETSN